MAFILWIHIHPSMTLNENGSPTTQNKMNIVTRPVVTDRTISPKEIVSDPLKPISILLRE